MRTLARFRHRPSWTTRPGTITEPAQDGSYWLNSDNGPANAYIVIDLGAGFHLASFDLFNTHNANFGDRGTGNFTIEASNSIAPGSRRQLGLGLERYNRNARVWHSIGSEPLPLNGPLVAQTFLSSDPGTYRYIRFSPHTVASFNPPCCGANVYGLNELRAFDAPDTVPEPATMALFGVGLAVLGLLRKRTA